MSHHALHLGHAGLAVNLARAGQVGTAQIGNSRAAAMLTAMEAVAQAADSNHSERHVAATLRAAEAALAKAGSTADEPDWLDFDEGALCGAMQLAHTAILRTERRASVTQPRRACCVGTIMDGRWRSGGPSWPPANCNGAM